MTAETDWPANTMTGAGVIAGFLRELGIDTVFALAGASHSHLLAALDKAALAVVPTRHETATVAAADGYARVSGKLGVALIIAEQGAPNAVSGIANAFYASSPVMVLVARLPARAEEADGEVDLAANLLVRPITKWAREAPSADQLGEYVRTAHRWATQGRPGPVVLSFPQDLLAAPVEAPRPTAPPPASPAALDPAVVEVIVGLLATSRRPILLAGSEATRSGAGAALKALADLGVPVLGNGLGRGLVAEDGARGWAWPFAQIAADRADLVIFAGARPTRRFGFGLPPRFAPDARMVQIDTRAETLHRNRTMDVAAAAHVGAALAQVAKAAQGRNLRWSSAWLADALAPRRAAVAAEVARTCGPIHPLELAAALERLIPANAVVVGDGADIQNWMYGALRARAAPGFLEHYPLGSMGVGTPLALGAAAAVRSAGRRVVLVTGDGSFGFHPFEIESAKQAGLDLTVVIGNDGAWGTEMHGQKKAFGRAFNTAMAPYAYEKVAEAFDIPGFGVSRREELEPALRRALAAPGPSLVNVLIDPEAGAALKSDPLLNNILFSDITEGRRLAEAPGARPGTVA